MGSSTALPTACFQTGVISEGRSLEWKITNFPVVLKQASMVNLQMLDFVAGAGIGLASKWMVYLDACETRVGLYVRLKEGPAAPSEHLYAEFTLTFKGKDGLIKMKRDSEVMDWYDSTMINQGYGIKLFDINDSPPSYMELTEDGSLVVYLTFKMFAISKASTPLEEKLNEFQIKSTAKTRADLAMLIGNPVSSNDIRIIASDEMEFKMQKDILSARSPVFRAMLEADMTEGTRRVVEMQDMGSKSLKTLLHFMYCGELLPEWNSSEVLVELTNAAAKYWLTDLLQFLDGVLGDVCSLHNVGALIPLAHRLSLKTAEEELLSFMKRNGANSAEDFMRVANGILALDSNPGEASSGAMSAGQSVAQTQSEGRRGCGRRRQGKRNADDLDEDCEEIPRRSKRSRKARGYKK